MAEDLLQQDIRTEKDIEPILKAAMKSGKPCVVNCHISCDANVFPMVPAGKGIHEQIMDLED
jgi:acetolactate synthase-1/2/3 large subunit